jgi:hypothetical protein
MAREWVTAGRRPRAVRHLRTHVPGQRLAHLLAVLPRLRRAAVNRDRDARASLGLLPSPTSRPDGRLTPGRRWAHPCASRQGIPCRTQWLNAARPWCDVP